MHPEPHHAPFARWAGVFWIVCAVAFPVRAQQPSPAELLPPDATLRAKPETGRPVVPSPALPQRGPAPTSPVPDELKLVPTAPPPSPARPPVTTPGRAAVPGATPSPASATTMLPRAPSAQPQQLLPQAPQLPAAPAFPIYPTTPPAQPSASTSPLLLERFVERRSAGARLNVRERAAEIPLGLQRHPTSDLGDDETATFTLQAPTGSDLAGELSFGLLNETRFSNNIDGTPPQFAREDTVNETTPQFRLRLGDAPGPRGPASLDSEYYLQLEYLPTVRTLIGAGEERVLQRVRADFGRVNPISTLAVHFEYDENLFALSGLDSPEDSFTLLEVAPRLEYRPSDRTLIRALPTYDRIEVESGVTDRSDYILDLGLFWDYSVKTQLGAGVELRHILFDDAALGEVDYEYSYLSCTWRATPKFFVQFRAGAEFRQLDRPGEPNDNVEPAATLLINWLPAEATSLSAGFLARNQPSVTGHGELYQDLRFALDGTRDLSHDFYVRGELVVRQRDYETGRREFECTVRPAIGYRPLSQRALNSLRVELFYQHRLLDSNQPGADFTQEMVGIQSLIAF